MSPAEQLTAIRERLMPMREALIEGWRSDLQPKLRDAGIQVLDWSELKGKQRKALRKRFEREIFPTLTPLAFDPSHPFPHISNLSINLAVVVRDPVHGERFARLKVPGTFPRLLRILGDDEAGHLGLAADAEATFLSIEEVIAANLDLLFPGLEVVAAHPFRVTRDADVEIEEDEAGDLLTAMEEVVGQRHFGSAVRLEIDERMPQRIRDILVRNLGLQPYQVFMTKSPIGRADLIQLYTLDRPDLKYPPATPVVQLPLLGDEGPFPAIRRRDFALYHPYDSFAPVVDFLEAAAHDPDVLAIKQTLYRVGLNSPVVQALIDARENGKQVSALVELKARFDEENNIEWARALDSSGVHVVYGVFGLKTHAKVCLVVRREADGIRRYVHLATGNYNPATARAYGDLGFFTADPELAEDVSDLFNALTGYSRKERYRKLLVAPGRMREELLERIERETERHTRARRRLPRVQDERARRQGLHPRALPRLAGGGEDRPPGARRLLPAPGRAAGVGDDHRHLARRPLPRARADVLLPKRRRRGAVPRQRRPDAAKPRRPRRSAVPDRKPAAARGAARRRALHPPARQRQGMAVVARRLLREGAAARGGEGVQQSGVPAAAGRQLAPGGLTVSL